MCGVGGEGEGGEEGGGGGEDGCGGVFVGGEFVDEGEYRGDVWDGEGGLVGGLAGGGEMGEGRGGTFFCCETDCRTLGGGI